MTGPATESLESLNSLVLLISFYAILDVSLFEPRFLRLHDITIQMSKTIQRGFHNSAQRAAPPSMATR
jgi:hypothetical protein